MRRRDRGSLLAGCAAAALVLLTGCSGTKEPPPPTPAQALQGARAKLDGAGTVAFTLRSERVPADAAGVSGAKGHGVMDTTKPRFSGTITGRIQGVSAEVGLIAIGDKAWMKFLSDRYAPVDLEQLGAPNPAALFVPGTGLSSLLADTADPKRGERSRLGSEVVQLYTGTVPGKDVERLFKIGDGTSPVAAVWGVTESGELRSGQLTGTFYGTGEQIYRVVLSDYGTPVEITAP